MSFTLCSHLSYANMTAKIGGGYCTLALALQFVNIENKTFQLRNLRWRPYTDSKSSKVSP